MMERIRSRAGRSVSSDSGSFTRRRTRSSSITSPSSFTSPTTLYRDSDQGRLGIGFSVLKLEMPRSQTPQASLSKISALPPWLQDTINELGASHPLRAVFPAPHDASDLDVARSAPENSADYQRPRHPHPNDIHWSLRLPSTPPRIPPSMSRQPDSETSSDGPRPFSTHYTLYRNNSLLHLRSGSPAPSVGARTQPESASPNASNPYPSPVAPIKVANGTHISRFKTTPRSASSLNHEPPVPSSPAPRPDVDYDGVFRYNPSQADSGMDLSPQPPAFERPIRTYFDSPTEDPISSDPLGPEDYDPFKLDPEEYKNLGFKWAPFDCESTLAGVPGASARSPDVEGTDKEVLVSNSSSYSPTHPHLLLLGYVRFPRAKGTGYIRTHVWGKYKYQLHY